LAIAANLHRPYRIEIGIENIEKAKIKDKQGKGKKIIFLTFSSKNLLCLEGMK
jgi:hypothetical protein